MPRPIFAHPISLPFWEDFFSRQGSLQKKSKRQDFDQQEISRTVVVPKRAVFKTLIFVLAALFFFVPKTEFWKSPFWGPNAKTLFKGQNPLQRGSPAKQPVNSGRAEGGPGDQGLC